MQRKRFRFARKYFGSSCVPVKKHRDSFHSTLKKLKSDHFPIFELFAPLVKQSFVEAEMDETLANSDWAEAAECLSKKNQMSLANNQEDLAEQKSVNWAEKILGFFFETSYMEAADKDSAMPQIKKNFVEAAQLILDAEALEAIQSPLACLKQIAAQEVGSSGTLDTVLDYFFQNKDKPLLRVVWNSIPGKAIYQEACAANVKLQSKATATGVLQDIVQRAANAKKDERWTSFERSRAEPDAEQLVEFMPEIYEICRRCVQQLEAGEDMVQNSVANEAACLFFFFMLKATYN